MIKRFSQILLFVSALLPLLACADEKSAAPAYVAGKHYEVLPTPIPLVEAGKIEVAEFFWYGCVHCYHFEPSVAAWLKKLPKDVNFVRVPAVWHPDMAMHARMYYAAQQLNKLDEMHDGFFNAMQVGKMKLNSREEIAKLFAEKGVSSELFAKTFDSFGTDSMVKQAQAKATGAKISGTPELVVNGKYRISSRGAGSQAEMLKVADFLIAQERAAKK